ncbi:hypothetical protein A2U01_0111695, partial [Trifolium medium]|nr:hypothetical protein [Trifolium medium]
MHVRCATIFPSPRFNLHAIQGELSLLLLNYSRMAFPSKANAGSGPKNTE